MEFAPMKSDLWDFAPPLIFIVFCFAYPQALFWLAFPVIFLLAG